MKRIASAVLMFLTAFFLLLSTGVEAQRKKEPTPPPEGYQNRWVSYSKKYDESTNKPIALAEVATWIMDWYERKGKVKQQSGGNPIVEQKAHERLEEELRSKQGQPVEGFADIYKIYVKPNRLVLVSPDWKSTFTAYLSTDDKLMPELAVKQKLYVRGFYDNPKNSVAPRRLEGCRIYLEKPK